MKALHQQVCRLWPELHRIRLLLMSLTCRCGSLAKTRQSTSMMATRGCLRSAHAAGAWPWRSMLLPLTLPGLGLPAPDTQQCHRGERSMERVERPRCKPTSNCAVQSHSRTVATIVVRLQRIQLASRLPKQICSVERNTNSATRELTHVTM